MDGDQVKTTATIAGKPLAQFVEEGVQKARAMMAGGPTIGLGAVEAALQHAGEHFAAELNALKDQLPGLQDRLSSTAESVLGDVAAIEKRWNDALASAVSSITSRVSSAESSLSSLSSSMSTLGTRVSAIEAAVKAAPAPSTTAIGNDTAAAKTS